MAQNGGYSAEDLALAGLDQAEIDAINEEGDDLTGGNLPDDDGGDDAGGDDAGADDKGGTADDKGGDDKGASDDKGAAGDDKGADDKGGAPDKGGEKGADDQPAAKPVDEFVPKFSGETPPEIQAKLDALDQQFEDGEIDLKAYNRERDKLRDEVIDARVTAQREAAVEAARAKAQEEADKAWKADANSFLAAEENADFRNIGEMYARLDAEVKFLAVSAAVVEKMRAGQMNNFDLLEMAKSNVLKVMGLAVPAAKATDTPRPTANKDGVKSLRDVPAADANGTDSWKVQLDNLAGTDGVEYERKFGQLSEAQQEEYLRGR
jgi:hypothetical protein